MDKRCIVHSESIAQMLLFMNNKDDGGIKEMKKLLVMILTIVMVTSLFVGCGSKTEEPTAAKPAKTEAAKEEATKGETEKTEAKEEMAGLPFEGVELTIMMDQNTVAEGVEAVAAIAKEQLGLDVSMDRSVGGSEGDNLTKTRLASGDMTDLFVYNSGSLLGALNPSEYLLDISGEPFMAKIADSFKGTVAIDGAEYGIPLNTIMAGGIMYNKAVYRDLGLEVPTTWDEFLANCEVIKASGTSAVIGTYGDAWTSQVTFLGDNYNVLAENPNFATEFEAGTAKFATSPAGVKSFQKLIDIEPFLNLDYAVATFDEGVDMLATGEGAHWPMLSFVMANVSDLYPEAVEDIGVFGIPGDNPDDQGLTIWMPNALYVNKDSENIDAVKAFFELYLSTEGLDAYTAAVPPTGAYVVEGYALPGDTMSIVKDDMQAYIDSGKTAPALEYMTAVKGPNCPAITQEVGSGQTTALEAAAAYDADCLKQAIQLGLDW